MTRKSNRSVTFATSSKTTQHGPIYDAPEPLPMRRFQEKITKNEFWKLEKMWIFDQKNLEVANTYGRTEILQFWVHFCKEEV